MNLFRTNKTLKRYQTFKALVPKGYCPLCDTANIVSGRTVVKKYNHWIMIENDFPYDKLAKVHRLLLSKRHIGKEKDLTMEEVSELIHIKNYLLEKDDYEFMENNIRRKSIQGHFHIHLLIWK